MATRTPGADGAWFADVAAVWGGNAPTAEDSVELNDFIVVIDGNVEIASIMQVTGTGYLAHTTAGTHTLTVSAGGMGVLGGVGQAGADGGAAGADRVLCVVSAGKLIVNDTTGLMVSDGSVTGGAASEGGVDGATGADGGAGGLSVGFDVTGGELEYNSDVDIQIYGSAGGSGGMGGSGDGSSQNGGSGGTGGMGGSAYGFKVSNAAVLTVNCGCDAYAGAGGQGGSGGNVGNYPAGAGGAGGTGGDVKLVFGIPGFSGTVTLNGVSFVVSAGDGGVGGSGSASGSGSSNNGSNGGSGGVGGSGMGMMVPGGTFTQTGQCWPGTANGGAGGNGGDAGSSSGYTAGNGGGGGNSGVCYFAYITGGVCTIGSTFPESVGTSGEMGTNGYDNYGGSGGYIGSGGAGGSDVAPCYINRVSGTANIGGQATDAIFASNRLMLGGGVLNCTGSVAFTKLPSMAIAFAMAAGSAIISTAGGAVDLAGKTINVSGGIFVLMKTEAGTMDTTGLSFNVTGTGRAVSIGIEGGVDGETMDYPVPGSVLAGVEYGGGGFTGEVALPDPPDYPDPSNVLVDVVYGSGLFTGEVTLPPPADYPAPSNVLEGVEYGGGLLIGTAVASGGPGGHPNLPTYG